MPAVLKTCCLNISQRWVTAVMCFLGAFNVFAMRVSMSIAITKMVIPKNHTVILYSDDTCPKSDEDIIVSNVTIQKAEMYDWSESTQGLIFSSFYWGYIFTNILGGLITQKFGGRHSLGISILSTSVLTLLTPASVYWGGSTGLIFTRVLMGLGEGTTYPGISDLLSKWIPLEERSKAGALVYSGAPLGTICSMIISGVILQYSETGWPMVFYFFGTLGILSFLLNYAFCYSSPSDNPFINDTESEYLKEKLTHLHKNIPPTPWRYILRSPAVWALLIETFGVFYGFITIISDIPKYMSSVLKMSVQRNGYLTSILHLSKWISSCILSWIADWLIVNKKLTVTQVRKGGATIASIGSGIFLVAASYAGCDINLVITLLTIGLTCMSCITFSVLINSLDLVPNYAGSVTGFVNGFGTLGGVIAPYIAGILTPNQSISEWRLVFWIVLGVYVFSNLIFIIFGSGDLQEWNNPNFLEKDKGKGEDKNIKEATELLQKEKNTSV